MIKYVKTFFIRKRTLDFKNKQLLRNYPKSFKKVGIILSPGFELDINFITKLKIGFGDNIQIFTFVLNDKNIGKNKYIAFNLKDFNLLGQLKNEKTYKILNGLDLLIDMTNTYSIVKTYALYCASNAYKISAGKTHVDVFNLMISVGTSDQKKFVDEIIKYHNILKNG